MQYRVCRHVFMRVVVYSVISSHRIINKAAEQYTTAFCYNSSFATSRSLSVVTNPRSLSTDQFLL